MAAEIDRRQQQPQHQQHQHQQQHHHYAKTKTTTTTTTKVVQRTVPVRMTVIPGKQARACLDVFAFILCLLLIALQLGLLDYYFLTNLSEKWWYAWVAADALVIIIMVWILVLALRHNQRSMEELCTADAKVKYAWVGWLAYALVLVGKLATCFRLFYNQLPAKAGDNDKIFNDHLFRLCLSLSVLIFMFLLEAHHYTYLLSQRQLYVTYLVTAICLDLIDTIYFLDLLWQNLLHGWKIELWLELVILSLACINLVLPGFALLKLRFSKLPKNLLIGEKVWALLYVLAVNAPFLGIRIYLYVLLEVQQKNIPYDPSLFAVKNVAMIYLAIREVWSRLQYWRQKRQTTGSRGELTAAATQDDEH